MSTIKEDVQALRTVPRTAFALLTAYAAQCAVIWYLLFLAFSACGPPPRFVTKLLKVDIYGSELPPEQFEDDERLLFNLLPPTILASANGAMADFMSYEEMNKDRERKLNGLSNPVISRAWIVDYGCVARTAYLHELFHIMQWKAETISDPNHEDPRWRYIDGNVLSCETYFKEGRIIPYKEVPRP